MLRHRVAMTWIAEILIEGFWEARLKSPIVRVDGLAVRWRFSRHSSLLAWRCGSSSNDGIALMPQSRSVASANYAPDSGRAAYCS